MKNKKKSLEEKIAEGIHLGFWQPIFWIIISLSVIIIGLFLISMVFNTISYGGPFKSMCSDGGCQMAATDNCNLDRLECKIVFNNETQDEEYLFDSCGYTEADYKYKQIRQWLEKDFRESKYYEGNWGIARYECI